MTPAVMAVPGAKRVLRRLRIARARRRERPKELRSVGDVGLQVARLRSQLGGNLGHHAPGEVLESVVGLDPCGKHTRRLRPDMAGPVTQRRAKEMSSHHPSAFVGHDDRACCRPERHRLAEDLLDRRARAFGHQSRVRRELANRRREASAGRRDNMHGHPSGPEQPQQPRQLGVEHAVADDVDDRSRGIGHPRRVAVRAGSAAVPDVARGES